MESASDDIEKKKCQNDVEWETQEMFVKTYIDNPKFLTKNISYKIYRTCQSIGLVNTYEDMH